MYDKKGTRYLFGASSQGQQSATTSPSSVYKWMLEEVRDTNDNYISYTYLKDENQIYPYQIKYTGNGVSDGPSTITIATSTRSDQAVSYKSGFKVLTAYRISQITATFNSTNVRQWALGYGTGNNGSRSLLTSIQETGWNDAGTQTTLPAATFEYVSTTTPFYGPNLGTNVVGSAYVVADSEGDGINGISILYLDGGSNKGKIISPDGNTTTNLTSPAPPEEWSNSGGGAPLPTYLADERGVRYLDVNADGKPDVVRGIKDDYAATTTKQIYENTYAATSTYGWTNGISWSGTIPEFAYKSDSTHSWTTGIFGDINGDGLPDYEESLNNTGGAITNGAYLGNGTAWDAATTTIFAAMNVMPDSVSGPTVYNPQLIDINGDSLADWVSSDSSNTYVQLNTGTGWVYDTRWIIATSTLYHSTSPGNTYYDRGIRFMDMNGDGLPDFVRAYANAPFTGSVTEPEIEVATISLVLLNTGSGWATSTAYTLAPIASPYHDSGTSWTSGVIVYNEYANWIGNGQMQQDVLATTTSSKGGSTTVSYGLTTQTSANTQLPYALLTVNSITDHDGRGSNERTDYAYSGGLQYLPSNVYDRKFAGFASTTETRPDKTTVRYYHQGTLMQTALGEQSNGYAHINHPFREDVFTPSGTSVQKTFYRWDPYTNASSTLILLGRKLEQNYASNGTHRDKDTDYAYATSTGDIIRINDFGEVSGNSNGTFSDISGDSRTTRFTYAASSSVFMSVPIQKTLLDNSSATSTDTKLYYDSLAFGSVGRGNQTMQKDWISGDTYASTTRAYNTYGLASSSTDRGGNLTSYVYDSFNLYPATSTNASSQSTRFTYNYSNGKTATTTDPNTAIAKNMYDGVGRLTEMYQSDTSNPSTLVTKATYTFTDSTSTPSLIRVTQYLNSATTTDTYTFYDGLNRPIQERKSTETAGTYATTDRIYHRVGNLASTTLPYFSSGTSLTTATSTTALYTEFLYDPLGRPTKVSNSVGSTTNTYGKWTTTTVDPNGSIKEYLLDAYGNLSQVVEHATSTATTTYTYDAAGNLALITDAASSTRAFTYDGLGRRTGAQDLHASGDATFGSWSYSYDDVGNLTSQTDPKAQVITHTFDALNRMVTEALSGSGVQITNTYDSCTYGVGRLCSASSTAALNAYEYDVLGRTSIATSTVNGTGYATVYGYDRQGNQTSITYPDKREVSYVYNAAGLMNSVSTKPVGGAYSSVLSATTYAPDGKPLTKLFGNGVETTYTYDPLLQYRLTRMLTGTNAGTSTEIVPLVSDPVAYWNLDESNGVAYDAIASNDLTNNNSVSYATGTISNAATFVAANSQSLQKLTASGLPTGSESIAAWVKFTSLPVSTWYGIVEQGNAATSSKFGLTITDDPVGADNLYSLAIDHFGGTNVYSDAWSGVATGTWYHVAATYDGTNFRWYVNGSQLGAAKGAGTQTTSGAQIVVGAMIDSSLENFLNGSVDEVGVWDNVLTQSELTALYNAGAGEAYPFGTTTVSTYGYANLIQDLNYTYDAVGNITNVTNNSTTTGSIADFLYDDLHRLTSVSFAASSTATTTGMDVLVVAGGGGGGGDGGGGGGGGVKSDTVAFTTPQAYSVTVGAGGAGGVGAASTHGGQGEDSVFSGITAHGGGYGAAPNGDTNHPAAGGSGGGASYGNSTSVPTTGGAGTSPEGQNGGGGLNGSTYGASGGGGGAGATGADSPAGDSGAGAGGVGISSSISGAATYYGGGGGGGAYQAAYGGNGGSGGGGGGASGSGTQGTGGSNGGQNGTSASSGTGGAGGTNSGGGGGGGGF